MKVLILALAMVVAAPTATLAQDAIRIGDRQESFERLSNEFRPQKTGGEQLTWRDVRDARSMRRAEAAADLINSGDCVGASALAERARDRALVASVARICDAPEAEQPATLG